MSPPKITWATSPVIEMASKVLIGPLGGSLELAGEILGWPDGLLNLFTTLNLFLRNNSIYDLGFNTFYLQISLNETPKNNFICINVKNGYLRV